ncbi:hypothetical protein TNIN_313081 [Trichonephila inaurata madagascariensis]|uniref:Uncharacterized protein n=1 Tax=Trichonephila inaurata madagascariensis TaxID=2747483 RepID=A0A8X6YGQ0_9ARAC|nr:hypothetical protein TNIN_313081 [Trichonephila inaurata madagascariensis]
MTVIFLRRFVGPPSMTIASYTHPLAVVESCIAIRQMLYACVRYNLFQSGFYIFCGVRIIESRPMFTHFTGIFCPWFNFSNQQKTVLQDVLSVHTTAMGQRVCHLRNLSLNKPF